MRASALLAYIQGVWNLMALAEPVAEVSGNRIHPASAIAIGAHKTCLRWAGVCFILVQQCPRNSIAGLPGAALGRHP